MIISRAMLCISAVFAVERCNQ